MSLYTDYLNEIETRKEQGLHPKPIEDAALVEELILQVNDLVMLISGLPGLPDLQYASRYNECSGGESPVPKENRLGGHRSGRDLRGLRVGVIAHEGRTVCGGASRSRPRKGFGDCRKGRGCIENSVFLYEADTDRLAEAHAAGNSLATDLLMSYSTEFFTSCLRWMRPFKSSPTLQRLEMCPRTFSPR